MKAVIVDDELARLPRTLLGRIAGLQVVFVEEPERTVRVIEAHAPDVVCVNYFFGGNARTGIAVVTDLRHLWDASELYIVGISSSPFGADAMRGAGVNEVVGRIDLPRRLESLTLTSRRGSLSGLRA